MGRKQGFGNHMLGHDLLGAGRPGTGAGGQDGDRHQRRDHELSNSAF